MPETVNARLAKMRLLKSKTEPVHLEDVGNDLMSGKAFKQVVPPEDRDEPRDDDDDLDFSFGDDPADDS